MTSHRPYVLRALIDWIVDNGCTPMVHIDCGIEGVSMPSAYVKDGGIVLNLSPTATRNLAISNAELVVDCRFGGRPHRVAAPIHAVSSVFARENGKGLTFGPEPNPPAPESPPKKPEPPKKRPHLSIVK